MAEESTVYDLGFNKSLTRNTKIAGFNDAQSDGSGLSMLPNSVENGIVPSTIQSGSLNANLEQSAGVLFNVKTSFTDTTAGYRLGIDTTDNLFKFLIGNSTNSLYWNGSTLVITGSITATTGSIGGFEIGSDYIRDAANSFGLASTVSTTPAADSIELTARTVSLNGTTGLTMIVNASLDDANILITLPFSVTFNGVSYTNVYVGSNGYLTFGAGSSVFNSLSASNPAIPGIHINARDGSYQRVYKGSLDGNATYIIRYEGSLLTSGTPGSSNVFWEIKFTAATPDIFLIDIGSNAASAVGTSGITSGSAYIKTFGSGYVNQGYTLDFSYPNPAVAIDDVRFWAGAAYADRATAPARITEAGVATFSSGTVGGWTLSSTTLVGGSVTLNSTGVITVGTSNDIATLSAVDATYRLWTGNATAASAPFRVTKAGALTATSATITGAITASSGSITGGFTIGTGGSFSSGQSAYDTGTGFWLEYNAGTPRFSIGAAAGNKLTWNGSTLAITGTLTATSGAIGGWSIGATTLTGGDATLSSTGFLNLGTSNDIVKLSSVDATYRLWVGHATAASAPFSVTKAGAISATSGAIGGWTLAATTLTATSIVLDSGNQKITVGSGSPNLVIDGANNQIGTSLFVSGQSGWRITGSGNAEFNNIVARGEFRTAVFVKDEIHATGGTMIVLTASTLYADATTVTTPTTSTIDIQDPPSGHAQLFNVNDILRIKDGSGKDNWLKVTAVSDQTTFYRYTVDKQSGTNGTFYKGTAVVNYRTSTDGFVLLTSDLSNGPYIDIGLSSATPWSGTTAKARLGNLAGITDSTFGALSGFGLWTNNGYFTGSVFATAGYFGDAITRVAIEAAGINVGTTGSIRGGQTAYDTGTGFWIGQVTSTPKLSLGNSAGNKLTWDGTTLSITGTLTASAGAIGGFTIGATSISATNLSLTSGAANTANISVGTGSNLAGLNSGNSGSDNAFWAGATFANRATAPFRVDLAGNLIATSATVNGSAIANGDIYGDGSDGDVTISSNTTITRDMFYNNLTISAGFSLNTGGFRVFVKGTCTIEATASIHRNGNDASGQTGGAALASGSLQGALAGKDGGGGGASKQSAGAGTAVNGDNGTVGSTGVSVVKSLVTSSGVSLAGKTSGNGGGGTYTVSGGTGQIGGVGGSISGTVYNQIRTAMAAYNLFDIYPESGSNPVLAAFKCAPSNGGASGGASGGARQEFASGGSPATSGAGGYGGGGGGQAGIVSLFARILVNNGTISADGGDAANGQNGGNASVDATLGGQRNAGGGGGGCGGAAGNGGVVICVYGSKTGSGTITAAAGTLGTKGLKGTGAGAGGVTGADGTDGQDGIAGNSGTVIELQV